MLCTDLGGSEAEALPNVIYNVSYFHNGSFKVHIQKAMLTGKLAKWKMLLSESNIKYITQKTTKGQDLTDHLA